MNCVLPLTAFAVRGGVAEAEGPRGADQPERAPDPRGRRRPPAALPCGAPAAGGGQPAAACGHPAVQCPAGTCVAHACAAAANESLAPGFSQGSAIKTPPEC